MPVYDYSGEPEAQPRPTDQTDLEKFALEYVQLEEKIEAAEAEVKKLQAQLDTLAKGRIPEIMKQLRSSSMKLEHCGLQVDYKKKVRANIKEDDREEVFTWMETQGVGAIIKRRFTIEFAKEDERWANKFEKDLGKRKRPLDVERTKTVHPETLAKLVAGRLEAGKPVHEKIGVYEQPFVTVKKVK